MDTSSLPWKSFTYQQKSSGNQLRSLHMAVNDQGVATDLRPDKPAATGDPTGLRKKRNAPSDSAPSNLLELAGSPPDRGVNKKIKVTQERTAEGTWPRITDHSLAGEQSLVPPEVWHHVFTFCPPKSLGSLLAVDRRFNRFLDPASPFRRKAHPYASPGALQPLEPNTIWQASRRLFWPQMPSPLRSKTELDMWRLVCSPRCQSCGKLPSQQQPVAFDPRHPGPGPDGVAVVWVFGRRMCASCLLRESYKELDLQISPTIPSAIIPALAFIYLTRECDVFSATTLEPTLMSAAQHATKLFLKSDVELLRDEFLRVRYMGEGTVGEWLKGLPGRGSDFQYEASKWEKWESAGGALKMRTLLHPGSERKYTVSVPPRPSTHLPRVLSSGQGRHERTAEEAVGLKVARRREIERRSLLLDPPLTPDVLCLIPSFQAATQIVAELDDDAWERLRPRLLAQRADAETALWSRREAGPQINAEQEEKKLEETQHSETTLAAEKEARDRVDKAWEEVQAPLRAEIAGYADEAVRDRWAKGKRATRESCARFAVEVLLHVRKRFYAGVAEEFAAARAAGRTPVADPPEGPFTQKLTLENMKWIFDTKVKPLVESFRKELFFCNGCEGNHKSFGFEGVIQHYAAKHTNALSLGSIVVHWRAEWPEHTPFSAVIRLVKVPRTPSAWGNSVNGGGPLPVSYSYPAAGAVAMPPVHPYPPSMGYEYNSPAYSAPSYNGHFQPSAQVPNLYQPRIAAPPLFAPHINYGLQQPYAVPPAPYPVYQPPPIPYARPAVDSSPGLVWHQAGQHDYQHGPGQGSSHAGGQYAPVPSPALPDLCQAKLEDIAVNSREIWQGLGDIRDLPGDVRVFVTIHHLVKRFRSKFYETPPLSLFIDGLSNNKTMRPVRNVKGLVCKACRLGLGNAASVERDRKDYSLPQLANHFQSKHIDPMQMFHRSCTPLDWVVDMVSVSDLATIPRFASSANEPQKALLSAAFPDVFPLPAVRLADQPAPQTQSRGDGRTSRQGDLSAAVDIGQECWTNNGRAGRGRATDRVQATSPANEHIAGRPPRDQSPEELSSNGPSARTDRRRHSLHSHGRNRAQAQAHECKQSAHRDERGKAGGNLVFRALSRDGGARAEREVAGMDAHHEATSIGPSPLESLFVITEKPGLAEARQGGTSTLQALHPSHRLIEGFSAGSGTKEDEPNIMAALESYLERSQATSSQAAPGPAVYTSTGASRSPSDLPSGTGMYKHHHNREGLDQIPSADSSSKSVGGRGVGYASHSRPTAGESPGDDHDRQRGLAERNELPPRYREDERFRGPAPRAEARHRTSTHQGADGRRYEDDRHAWLQAPVEAYEIVHVIDEHGEYYIRRPVRRGPDPRCIYDERLDRHDSGGYPAFESIHGYGSQSSAGHEHGPGQRVPTGEWSSADWPG